ncbi:MAG: NAD(P)-binding domain-containing protein [Saprospiraceae bacterium]|nr:NAD(P)-binding domain-containing protein [Saprospiraceae bacterium]MCF8252869.1 NAD(P)-binding domain-containing protein [Saprospiraceae bacterium]MCF8313018.1 NAD(P)-binding domain-containing protein [Saprospiraceae bacterium]MCF8441465.1 NAD(P)-binding domain-containing protein [Saprospiraceae bacterium]
MKIGIIGAGSMGAGIAQVAATAGHEVFVFDSNPAAHERAQANLLAILNMLSGKGKIDDRTAKAIFGRVFYFSDLAAFGETGLVIEAIIEDLAVKKAVFKQLEGIVSADCLLATNTSSLSVAAIAAACDRPERVLGIHFFNPAPLMQLVEVVPAIQTAPDVAKQAKLLIESWGKLVVLAKDTPGFIVNRVARPFYGEALRILEEGIADVATIDWAMTEIGGFRMGPFTLMDFIGNDVNYTVTETVFQSFFYDPRYKPSFTQKRLSEAGWLGKKSGKGYYDYSEGAEKPVAKQDKEHGEVIFARILVMLINEAADALYLRIASRDDIDLAMTKGVNYPKGLLQWADEIGMQNCVHMLDALHNEYLEDRYRCSVLLRKMAKAHHTFYGK